MFDPLDGTTNFAHGVPIFCASLALEIDGEAVVARGVRSQPPGAVHRRARRRRVAERRADCVSPTATVLDSLLVTGFPYDVHQKADEVVGLFGGFSWQARAVRRLGSAAIDLCWVAAGRMDGFWEARLQPWDTRAGALILERPAAA